MLTLRESANYFGHCQRESRCRRSTEHGGKPSMATRNGLLKFYVFCSCFIALTSKYVEDDCTGIDRRAINVARSHRKEGEWLPRALLHSSQRSLFTYVTTTCVGRRIAESIALNTPLQSKVIPNRLTWASCTGLANGLVSTSAVVNH